MRDIRAFSAASGNMGGSDTERRSYREVLSPTGHIVLARWCRGRRAGNVILIEGSPPGEMHHTLIRLVNRQSSCGGDVASHARLVNAGLPYLEGADDAARHEHPAGLADRVVHSIAEDLAIRTAETVRHRSPRSVYQLRPSGRFTGSIQICVHFQSVIEKDRIMLFRFDRLAGQLRTLLRVSIGATRKHHRDPDRDRSGGR